MAFFVFAKVYKGGAKAGFRVCFVILNERSICDGGNVCLLWLVILPLSVHISYHLPTQPMHEM